MKLRLSILVPVAAVVLSCTSPANPNQPATGFAYSEAALDAVLLKTSTFGTTPADFDAVILPPANRSVVPLDKLGKYLFGDEYVDDLSAYPHGPLNGTLLTNEWTATGTLSEPVRQVTGVENNLVRAIYQVDSTASAHNNEYHVYRYYPWTATAPSNIWFGAGHVFYLNPVKGQVAAGAPTLELFPTSATSDTVKEVRIEGSSYYKFRSLYAGNTNQGGTDVGSTLARVKTVLGAPTGVAQVVAKQDEITWSDRNVLFTYPDGAYIHYKLDDGTKVRLFFWGPDADSLHLIALYFVQN